jgi:hypothetical protein
MIVNFRIREISRGTRMLAEHLKKSTQNSPPVKEKTIQIETNCPELGCWAHEV